MKKILFCFLFFWIWNFSFSQSSLPKNESDSLWSIWSDETQPDTMRLYAMQTLSWYGYLFSLPDSAFYFSQLQLELATKAKEPKHATNALFTQATSFYVKSEFRKALQYYFLCLESYQAMNNISGETIALNNIGNIYSKLGNYPNAIQYYEQSLAIATTRKDELGKANCLMNIGILNMYLGEYARSYSNLNAAQVIYQAIGNKKGVSQSFINIGLLCSNQGDLEKALFFQEEAMKIKESIGDNAGVSKCLNNIGVIYADMQEYQKAILYYEKSLLIDEAIGEKAGVASSLNNLGIAYHNLGFYEKAIEFIRKALEIRRAIGDEMGVSSALINWSNCLKEAGVDALILKNREVGLSLLQESLLLANEAVEISRNLNAIYEYGNAAKSAYRSLILLDSIEQASQVLLEIKALKEREISVNFFTLSEREKQMYFQTLEEDLNVFFDFTVQHYASFPGFTDTAYNMAIRNKGITLKSTTAIRNIVLSSNDSLLLANYDEWIVLKQKIAENFSRARDTRELENQALLLERSIIEKTNAFSDFKSIQRLDWRQVRDGLSEDEAAIEFVDYQSEFDTSHEFIYAAFIIRRNSAHPDVVRLCTESDLKIILGEIQGTNLSFIERVYGKKAVAKKELYEKIWQPLEPFLKDAKTVYYSPSGLLHKVSFAAICKEQDVFLSDVYNFRQMGSTGNLAFKNKTEFGQMENFLLMGGVNYNSDSTNKKVWDYLPGSLAETNAINNYVEKKKFGVNYFHSSNASESIFKEKISSSSIVHIATHGFFFPDPEQVREEVRSQSEGENSKEQLNFRGTTNYANWSFVNNKNPLMRSGIVLANANDVWSRDPLAEGEDGILTAQEVSNLDLRNTKLVVLSACETGLGDIKGSEGVFGLQRAFKMAGVKYLIMSLWQVPDKETSEFMILFYKNLIKLRDIPTAFQKTQKVMREKYDPYYWGAFVLIE